MISTVHNRLVMSFTEPGNDDNTGLTAALNHAYTYAHLGNYHQAIAVLLSPTIWAGLNINNYNLWAGQIWNILVLRASRLGQLRLYNEFLRVRRPNIPHNPREYWFGAETPIHSIIRDPLYDVLYMRETRQAHQYIEPLLTALWHAEYQQRWGLYRTAVIMLADIGLEFGMTKWSHRLIEQIMPQIITAHGEQKGFGLVTYARCLIAAGESSTEALKACLPHLLDAERTFRDISLLKSLEDVRFLLSTVYHNLGMEKERDAMAEQCHHIAEERKKVADMSADRWISDLWEDVSRVGAAIAAKT